MVGWLDAWTVGWFVGLLVGSLDGLLVCWLVRCPVVCSSIPSLTEIGGDAILTFNPKDSYQMAEVIEQVFVNPSIRFLLKSRCHANVQKFNWTTTAQQTWDLYMELLRERLHEDVSMENWKIKNLGRLF